MRTKIIFASIFLFLLITFFSSSFADSNQTLYGHKKYAVTPEENLVSVGLYRDTSRVVRLHEKAAAAFKRMKAGAQKDAVLLVPISGFRTFAYQQGLFNRAIKKYGSRDKAAKWVAPPGFSEHHTGTAIDIGDGVSPKCDVKSCFKHTKTYSWLNQNASLYGFKLSFPETQTAVSFEPWHWRFVESMNGTQHK